MTFDAARRLDASHGSARSSFISSVMPMRPSLSAITVKIASDSASGIVMRSSRIALRNWSRVSLSEG